MFLTYCIIMTITHIAEALVYFGKGLFHCSLLDEAAGKLKVLLGYHFGGVLSHLFLLGGRVLEIGQQNLESAPSICKIIMSDKTSSMTFKTPILGKKFML